jgi:hypothetical protein
MFGLSFPEIFFNSWLETSLSLAMAQDSTSIHENSSLQVGILAVLQAVLDYWRSYK